MKMFLKFKKEIAILKEMAKITALISFLEEGNYENVVFGNKGNENLPFNRLSEGFELLKSLRNKYKNLQKFEGKKYQALKETFSENEIPFSEKVEGEYIVFSFEI